MDSKRVATAFLVGLPALFAIIAGGVWLALLVLIVVFFASKEYVEILRHKGFLPSLKIMLTSSAIFAGLAFFNRFDLIPLAFTLSAIMAFMWVLFRGRQPYIANVATTLLGFVYCGWFPLHLLFLRNMGGNFDGWIIPSPLGAGYCLLILFAVLVTDTFCYIVGCKWGKNKLSPVISPNKTIEGCVIGSLVSTFICTMYYINIINVGAKLINVIPVILFLSIVGQCGDLFFSAVKREFNKKDFGNLIPGHGGILDRLDSIIFVLFAFILVISYI